MRTEIGGYFGLELNPSNVCFLHSDGYCVNSGKNALRLIVEHLSGISKIWLPYYTCEVILELIQEEHIPYEFYSINRSLEMAEEVQLHEQEYLLLTNYFGIKDKYILDMAAKYGDRLIVDNAQAFFCEPIQGIKTIYSPRKYVGVPDGGIAFGLENLQLEQYLLDESYDRCSHLLKRVDIGANKGYADFKKNDNELRNQPLKRMSSLTCSLLSAVNYESIKEKRMANFSYLHQHLRSTNLLNIDNSLDAGFACPMVYPYLPSGDRRNAREYLIESNVFVAMYWPNVLQWCEKDSLEYQFADEILPLPVDQRYGRNDMDYIINKLKEI